MTLDQTSREVNARGSFKKYLVDNLHSVETPVTFDETLPTPDIAGRASRVEKWVGVNFGTIQMASSLATQDIRLFLCTREDPEGYNLTVLRDEVYNLLVDSSQSDGTRRIPLYRVDTWASVGQMLVFVDHESAEMIAEDETKFKILYIRLRWGAKV